MNPPAGLRDRASSVALRVAVAVCAVAPSAAVVGCGASTGPARSHDASHEVDWTLQAKPTPNGVPASLAPPTGSLDIPCDAKPIGSPQWIERAGPPRTVVAAGSHVPIGEVVTVCLSAYQDDLPLDVTARQAGRTLARHHFFGGDEDRARSFTFLLGHAWTTGTAEVLTTQLERSATARFAVVDADGPPLIKTNAGTGTTAGRSLELAASGVRARARLALDAYVQGSDGDYRYRSSVSLRANRRGVAFARLLTEPRDAGEYLLRLRHGATSVAETQASLRANLVGKPIELPPGERPRDVFERHDAPPAGIASQLAYFQQGGPTECTEPAGYAPRLAFERELPRDGADDSGDDPTRVEIGERLHICPYRFLPDTPISLTLETPSHVRETQRLPASLATFPDIGAIEALGPDSERGTYRVVARQGARVASARFVVREASQPGYQIVTLRPGTPTVFVAGLPARAQARLLLYKTPEGTPPPNASFDLRASFVAAVPAQASARGIVTADLQPAPSRPGRDACYIVKVAYGPHVLTDLNNTIGGLCLPYASQVSRFLP